MSSPDPVPPQPGARPDRAHDTQPVRPTTGPPPGQGWVGGPPAGGTGETQPVPAAASPTRRRGPGWFSLIAVALVAALVGGGIVAAAGLLLRPAAALPVATTGGDTGGDTGGEPTPGASAAPVPLTAAVDWGSLAERVKPSVVTIRVAGRTAGAEGTGVVIDKIGHVLTNDHVATAVGTDAQIQVSLSDGRLYRAEIVGTDPSTDLAVLQLRDAPEDLVPASFGRSADVTVGQQVMAVGNPLGLSDTVTTGIISAMNRPVATRPQQPPQQQPPPFGQGGQGDGQGQDGQGDQPQGTEPVVTNALQTDAAINEGNSGGPLVNVAGQVIGINSAIASLSGGDGSTGSIGLGFAIPADEAKRISKELVTDGRATHAQLGVSLEGQPGTATADEATRQSATISAVTDGTPAAAAGLQVRDQVTAIDDVPTPGPDSLVAIVREHAPGDKVVLTVVRDGKAQKITATLGQRQD